MTLTTLVYSIIIVVWMKYCILQHSVCCCAHDPREGGGGSGIRDPGSGIRDRQNRFPISLNSVLSFLHQLIVTTFHDHIRACRAWCHVSTFKPIVCWSFTIWFIYESEVIFFLKRHRCFTMSQFIQGPPPPRDHIDVDISPPMWSSGEVKYSSRPSHSILSMA